MFDTHAHLNFKRFHGREDTVIENARSAGITHLVIPGTSLESSRKALEIAQKHANVYCAVGIHPHHVSELKHTTTSLEDAVYQIGQLAKDANVVAIGEIGIDRHAYKKTRHENYTVDDDFIKAQRALFSAQIQIASSLNKSLIIHNREAVADTLGVLAGKWDDTLRGRSVFHCCEADMRILDFAMKHDIFIGVDGDVTYDEKKQNFVKKIPIKLLVLETDSPFLLPEPLKSQKAYPNEPKNLTVVAQFVADLCEISLSELQRRTMNNAKKLFNISE